MDPCTIERICVWIIQGFGKEGFSLFVVVASKLKVNQSKLNSQWCHFCCSRSGWKYRLNKSEHLCRDVSESLEIALKLFFFSIEVKTSKRNFFSKRHLLQHSVRALWTQWHKAVTAFRELFNTLRQTETTVLAQRKVWAWEPKAFNNSIHRTEQCCFDQKGNK